MATEPGWTLRLDVEEPNALVAVGVSPDAEELGFASAGTPQDVDVEGGWELYALNVVPSARGSGLARALVAATVGDRACVVWVLADNGRGRAFYEREGWVADGAQRTHESSGLPEVRLRRAGGGSARRGP